MPEQRVDVDRMAETAQRLGLVSPDIQVPDDESADEILVVVSVHGGLVQDIGARRRDIPRLRIIVVDHDNLEEGGGQLGYTTEATALEDWSSGPEDSLARCKDELPEDLVAELDVPGPTQHDQDGE